MRKKDVESRTDLQPNQVVKFDIAKGPTCILAVNAKIMSGSIDRSPSLPSLCSPCSKLEERSNAEYRLMCMFENLNTNPKDKICAICEDILDDPVETPCKHEFCRACLLEWIPFQPRCPLDDKPLSKEDIELEPKIFFGRTRRQKRN